MAERPQGAPANPPWPSLDQPAKIGRYVVESRVGGGGMATVFRARPPEDLRDAIGASSVAVKMLLPEHAADAEFRAMFEEEAEISAALAHPNVVALHDFGQTAEGALFIVMEWVDGVDLGVALKSFRSRRLRMNPPIACAIVERALRGLHAAHSRVDRDGNPRVVVHRDVSPANILLGDTGAVKIADFGLARPLHRMRRTLPGVVKGKIAYLAPEQTFDRMVDPRTDVFAAGIVLWEALASRQLFRRPTDVKTILAIREARWIDIRPFAPGIDPRIVAILTTALQPDPDRRFASAAAFADALAAYLADLQGCDEGAIARLVADVRWARSQHAIAAPRMQPPSTPSPPISRRSAPSEPMPLVRTRLRTRRASLVGRRSRTP